MTNVEQNFIYLTLSMIVSFVFGDITGIFIVLIICTIIDYITGLTKGTINKNLSSKKCALGIAKKAGIFIIIGLVNMIEQNIMTTQTLLRNTIILFYIGSECLSILENLQKIGVKVPNWVKKIFDKLKNDNDKEN